MHADKYRDAFVEEYWAAWLRKLGRARGGRADARVNLELRVNGATVVRDVPAEELLLDFLRNRLGPDRREALVRRPGLRRLHGAGRRAAGERLLHARRARPRAREVTTIEGLAEQPEFALLEDAFMRHAALQCGFCTGGMLLTVSSLLRGGRARRARRGRARSLAGNLCRCTGYKGIVEAVCELAGVPAA